MSFLEPIFLAGMLAAALPVVIHLINRRRAVRVEFPALAFLLASQRRESRGIKVRQWILMALRICVVALVAFALAKPFIVSASGVTATERLPTATVFVVDTSYSMATGDWWERARAEFDIRSDRLRPWDEVAMVTTAPLDARPVPRLTGNHDALTSAFAGLEPGEHGTHLLDAMLAAEEILGPSELPNRKIVVISDFAEGGFPIELQPDEPLEFPVEFVDVRKSPDAPANMSIEGVEFEQEGSTRERLWRIDALVRNRGTEPVKAELRLEIGGEDVAGGLVDIPASGTAKHSFRHAIEGHGLRMATVRLSEPDMLPRDDARHVVIRLRQSIRALLVNGEPSSIPLHDEMFFMERALNPRADSTSDIVPDVTTRDGLESIALAEYDVVVLSNVSKLSPAAGTRLQEFVSSGGGLMITMGDQVDVTSTNEALGALLPKKLRGLKELARRDDPDAPIKITRFGPPRRQHPIFRVFQSPGGASLQQVSIFSYMLLEPSPPQQSELILSNEDHAPALLERSVGRGRVLLLTTTIDDEWTDLPYQPSFLPLARRSVQYLARRATSAGVARHLVGEPTKLDVSAFVDRRVVVVGPDDSRRVLEPIDGSIEFTPMRAGVYRLFAEDGDSALDALTFAANVDTRESNLQRLGDDTLGPWIGADSSDAVTKSAAHDSQKRMNLWPAFLFCVVVFLLFETILGARRSVLARIWRVILRREEPVVD